MQTAERAKLEEFQHLWHPCTQMKDFETYAPLSIKSAQGSYIELHDGRRLIDAFSSWWCKSLGHGHPQLKAALQQQLEKFEHVLMADTTHNVIANLSEKLTALMPHLNRAFFASDGACAIEIAMKMSVQARQIAGETERCRFMALSHSYHGDTVGAMSVSDVGRFKKPFLSMLMDVEFIQKLPYVTGKEDLLWHDCAAYWPVIEAQLEPHAKHLTAILIEPILQGAGGMLIISQDFFKRLQQWARAHHIHIIADEITSGLGRTGLALASQHAGIEPDFVCLSKGLTSGWLPMSVTLTTENIYQLFYDDYASGKAFLHSHTYGGNALAASVALATLNVLEQENIYAKVAADENYLRQLMQEIADATGCLDNIRNLGAMVAADLVVSAQQPRVAYQIYQKAIELGAFMRPIGNTLYWLPPLNTSRETLQQLQTITLQAITAVMQ